MGNKKREKVKLDLSLEADRSKFLRVLSHNKGRLISTLMDCGVSKTTLYRYRKKYPDFNEAIENAKSKQTDYVEGKLFELIDKGETSAIIFYLKTQGRDRGYGEKYVPENKVEKKGCRVDGKTAKILEDIKATITNALKNRGTFDEGFTFQIELTAMLLTKVRLMKSEIFDKNHHTVIIEKSREGNNRETVSPLETQFKQYLSASQAALRALGLNTDSKQRIEPDDGFNDFMNAFKDYD